MVRILVPIGHCSSCGNLIMARTRLAAPKKKAASSKRKGTLSDTQIKPPKRLMKTAKANKTPTVKKAKSNLSQNLVGQDLGAHQVPNGSRQNLGQVPNGSGYDLGQVPNGSGQGLGQVPNGSGQDMGQVHNGSGQDLGQVPNGSGQDLGQVPNGSGQDLGQVSNGNEQDLVQAPNGSGQDLVVPNGSGEDMSSTKANNLPVIEIPKECECSICLDTSPYEKVWYLPCCHKYHVECIKKWLNFQSSCPICRMSLRGFGGTSSVQMQPQVVLGSRD